MACGSKNAGGVFIARSHRVPISWGINAIGMRRITWPSMGPTRARSLWQLFLLRSLHFPLVPSKRENCRGQHENKNEIK